ncbi:MAG TPA: hypothetical protein VHT27_00855 [Solirubrobacteraceae bacterium]|jgi:hypothetical protein|nr:hypothetical protein [Solirubrobacteraceae bacterium]
MRRAAGPAALCALAVLWLSACGNAAPQQAVSHNSLEGMLVNAFPVYWLGGSFHRLSISEAFHDTSGAYSLQYGGCLEGGQGTCVAPLRVVTSADNSFQPGGEAASHGALIRGVPARVAEDGRTIVLATDGVVVDIYAEDRSLARAAAMMVVPINQSAAPGAPLPAPQGDTGYSSTPLLTQEPTPLHPVR